MWTQNIGGEVQFKHNLLYVHTKKENVKNLNVCKIIVILTFIMNKNP